MQALSSAEIFLFEGFRLDRRGLFRQGESVEKVGGMADDAWHQHLAQRDFCVLPYSPLMLVPQVGGVEGIGVRLHLEDPACRIRGIAMPQRHPRGVEATTARS